VTHDHGGKADITLFHFSIKAQAARRKSLDERVPFHDKIHDRFFYSCYSLKVKKQKVEKSLFVGK
jgi:hypothetical protein